MSKKKEVVLDLKKLISRACKFFIYRKIWKGLYE